MPISIDGAGAKGGGLRRHSVVGCIRIHGWLLWWVCGKERCLWLGGTGVLADLFKVTLMHVHCLWGILADGGGGDARSGHMIKYPASMAAHHVDVAG
jgi:hypothetical protein